MDSNKKVEIYFKEILERLNNLEKRIKNCENLLSRIDKKIDKRK